jgi:hypothetical protein
MTMAAKGLAKLVEELGELGQVAGKKLAYYSTDAHPDGGAPLSVRFEEEMGDVRAAIDLVIENFGLSRARILQRQEKKRKIFARWQALTNNNRHGVDMRAKRKRRTAARPLKGSSQPSAKSKRIAQRRK